MGKGKRRFHLLWMVVVFALLGGCASPGKRVSPTGSPPASQVEAQGKTAVPGEQPGFLDKLFPQPQVSLGFTAPDDSLEKVRGLAAGFEEENPHLTIRLIPWGKEAPEGNFWRFYAESADSGLVFSEAKMEGAYYLDLAEFLAAEEQIDADEYWTGALDACLDSSSKRIGLPLDIGAGGIFINREAMQSAGIPLPAPEWTWQDFQTWLKQVQAAFPDRPAFSDHSRLPILHPFLVTALDAGEGNPSAERLGAELGWYREAVERGEISPLPWASGGEEWMAADAKWLNSFAGANPPLLFAGMTMSMDPLVEFSHEAADGGKVYALDTYAFLPFPHEEGTAGGSPLIANCVGISKGSNHPKETWKWIVYLSEHWQQIAGSDVTSGYRIAANRLSAEGSRGWETLPPDTQAGLRFALAHGYYGWLEDPKIKALLQAVARSLAEGADLSAALGEAMLNLNSEERSLDTRPIVLQAEGRHAGERGSQIALHVEQPGFDLPALTQLWDTQRNQDPQLPEVSIVSQGEGADCAISSQMPGEMFAQGKALELGAIWAQEAAGGMPMPEAGRYEGKLVGLPLSVQPSVIVYNRDLLEKWELQEPNASWTGEDFGQFFEEIGGRLEEGEYGFFPLNETVESYRFLLAALGVTPFTWNGDALQPAFTAPDTIRGLEWIHRMEERGVIYVPPEQGGREMAGLDLIAQGKIGLWIAPIGEETVLFQGAEPLDFDIGIVPLPTVIADGIAHDRARKTFFYLTPQSQDPLGCFRLGMMLMASPAELPGFPATGSPQVAEGLLGEIQRRWLESPAEDPRLRTVTLPVEEWFWEAYRRGKGREELEAALLDAQRKALLYGECLVQTSVYTAAELAEVCTAEANGE